MVDANYRFVGVEIGAPGSCSDAGIFDQCNLGKTILNGRHGIPQDDFLPGAPQLGRMPFVAVGDEAFPLRQHIMRPYGGLGHNEDERIFNYRLSRARMVSENAFGQLASRWRIFHTKISVDPPFAKNIVKAACLLHNMLTYDSARLQEDNVQANVNAFFNFDAWPRVQMQENTATDNRNVFKQFFTEVNPLDWQVNAVRIGL